MKLKYLFLLILIISYLLGISIGILQEIQLNEFYLERTDDKGILYKLYSMNSFDRFLYLAKSNMIISLKNMVFGIFSLGIFSLLYTFSNGLYSGIILGDCLKTISLPDILRSTIPHSIEIVGLVLFGYLGFLISARFFGGRNYYSFFQLLSLFFSATIIIITAAFIESYISMS